MRRERAGGDLAVELTGPAAGNLAGTIRAAAFGSQAVVLNEVSVAADQGLTALRTARIFPLADHAGEVASVDVTQSGGLADFGGTQQIFGSGVALTVPLHFVVGVKCGDVPWNVAGDAGEEFGEAAQLVGGVVEAGDEQRHDLKPQSHLVNAADAVEDGGDASAEFVIVAIVETLEINFVEIEMRAQIFEDLRRGVAVGNESGEKAGGSCLFENGDRPFAGDQGLIVGADQNSRALIEGVANQRLGSCFQRRRYRIRIAQRLRRDPVLTVTAMQVAAQHAETVSESAGMGVEERLFFDGIALHSGGVSPGNIERAAPIEADFANAGLAFGNGAAVTAGKAADALVVEFFVERRVRYADSLVQDVAEGGH